jgi:hypothetical protein
MTILYFSMMKSYIKCFKIVLELIADYSIYLCDHEQINTMTTSTNSFKKLVLILKNIINYPLLFFAGSDSII